MVVGVCQISLSLPGVTSLKAKRSIVRKVLDRTANRFNVSAAEVGHQDAHRQAVLGFAVVSGDRRHANCDARFDRVVRRRGGRCGRDGSLDRARLDG